LIETDELPTSISLVGTEIKPFITVPCCGLPIEAGGNPGYGIVGSVSRYENVTDALQQLEPDPALVSAKRLNLNADLQAAAW
jgi:hypothetical protein